MRFASWNIEDGGIDLGDSTRLRSAGQFLGGLELDVALVQEGKHWLGLGRTGLRLFEELTGMRAFYARAPLFDLNTVVLVRQGCALEVVRERHHEPGRFTHSQARVETKLRGTEKKILLASGHHSSDGRKSREPETEVTANLVVEWCVLGIDFNEPGVGDPPVDWASLPGLKRLHHEPDDRALGRHLLEVGLVDVAAYLADTRGDPTLREPTVGFRPTSRPNRSDQFHIRSDMVDAITDYSCIPRDESNHYPITLELDDSVLYELASAQGFPVS